MILETIFGIFLTVAGGDKSVDPTSVIIKGVQGANKIKEKKNNEVANQSNHVEVYLMTNDGTYIIKGEK